MSNTAKLRKPSDATNGLMVLQLEVHTRKHFRDNPRKERDSQHIFELIKRLKAAQVYDTVWDLGDGEGGLVLLSLYFPVEYANQALAILEELHFFSDPDWLELEDDNGSH